MEQGIGAEPPVKIKKRDYLKFLTQGAVAYKWEDAGDGF